MDKTANLLGNMIREGRERLQLTQDEVADRLQINLTHYGNIERGTNHPSLPLFIKIVTTLNLSVDAYIYPDSGFEDNLNSQIIRLINQCSDRERKIILSNIFTLLENREEVSRSDHTE